MSATLATKSRPELSKRPALIPALLRAGWLGIAGYFERRAAMARLGEYDECALRDIGITRSQIEAAVRGVGIPTPAASPRLGERRPASSAESVPWN